MLRRIDVLTTQIMRDKFQIVAADELKQGMVQLRLPFNEALSPYCWINTLLQKVPLERLRLQDFGVQVTADFAHLRMRDLAELIDNELLLLCDAHFDRYYARVDELS